MFGLACRVLKKGGRLVFLYPVERSEFKHTPEELPSHEEFELIDFCENPIAGGKSRILITMKRKLWKKKKSYKKIEKFFLLIYNK